MSSCSAIVIGISLKMGLQTALVQTGIAFLLA